MKNFNSLKSIATIVAFSLLTINAFAQITVTNTHTGQPYVLSNTGQNIKGTPLSGPVNIVDEDNGWNGNHIYSVGQGGTDYYAQSFIADVKYITRIGIVIWEYVAEGQVLLAIVGDNGGVPDYLHPLFQGTLINPTTTASWYYEDLNIEVTPGEKYYIMVDGYNNPGATGESYVGASNVYPIAGEEMIYSNDEGYSWDVWYIPMAIYVEGTQAPVPVSTWAIVIAFIVIGLITCLGFRRRHLSKVA